MSTNAQLEPRTTSRTSVTRGVAGWIDAHPFRALAGLALFYLIATAALSSLKLLWFDELITVNIAGLGSASAIWHALLQGADPNPPLIHLSVLASTRLFGAHEYAYRLPAILGYGAGLLALFFFLKRRVPPAWALTGTLLCMGMGGFERSFDSRSYAIFFGTTMWALLCWSRAGDPDADQDNSADQASRFPRRLRALAGMILALALGLCANYFSVLSFVPIALGELARTIQRGLAARHIQQPRSRWDIVDWPIWLSLAIAATPLLAFHDAIRRSIALYQPYAWNKVNFGMTTLAYSEMVEAMLLPTGLLFVVAGVVWTLSRLCPACRARLLPRGLRVLADGVADPALATEPPRQRARPDEIVAILVLMLYPYLGWAVATLHGGMFSSRMVLPVCIGFAVASACVAYRIFGQLRFAATCALASSLLWFMVRESYIGYSYSEQKTALYDTYKALQTVDDGHEPLVVSDNMLVTPFFYYAPPSLKARIVYPIDVPAIMRYRHQASGEVNLWACRQAYGFHILPLATFQHAASRYLIVTSGDDWLVDVLNEHHYRVDFLPVDTHAEPLNFVATPVSREKPVFFDARGDGFPASLAANPSPVVFQIQDELPKPFQPESPTPP